MIQVNPESSGEESPLLEIRDLHTVYETNRGTVSVVNGVNLKVRDGSTVGVVGESGSGKTQTFFSILGLDHGTPGVVGGSALWKGRDLLAGLELAVHGSDAQARKDHRRWRRQRRENLRGVRGREIGLLFQEPRTSLIPYWSVRRLLTEVAERAREPGRWKEFSALLSRLGFPDPEKILESFPADLSGGEAQRVMIAVATILGPELVIADEPTTALDAVSQTRVLAELESWASDQRASMVLISHDIAILQLLVDEIYVFFQGQVVEELTMARLSEAALGDLHPYTERLRESQRARAQGAKLAPDRSPSSFAPRADGKQPGGCPYAPVCGLRPNLRRAAQDQCESERPPLSPITKGQSTACWGLKS